MNVPKIRDGGRMPVRHTIPLGIVIFLVFVIIPIIILSLTIKLAALYYVYLKAGVNSKFDLKARQWRLGHRKYFIGVKVKR